MSIEESESPRCKLYRMACAGRDTVAVPLALGSDAIIVKSGSEPVCGWTKGFIIPSKWHNRQGLIEGGPNERTKLWWWNLWRGIERNWVNIQVSGIVHSIDHQLNHHNKEMQCFVQIGSNHCGADSFETWSRHDHRYIGAQPPPRLKETWFFLNSPMIDAYSFQKICIGSPGGSQWEWIIYPLRMEPSPEE